MKIDWNQNDGTLCVSLDGRLDTVHAPELESFLRSYTEAFSALVINCEKLAYVSSAGLRVLLAAHKQVKGAMKLTNVQELVMEVFDMTGFTDIFAIE